jgi:hypothetical protein
MKAEPIPSPSFWLLDTADFQWKLGQQPGTIKFY